MAHTKSARKRAQTSEQNRIANKSTKSALATMHRGLYAAAEAGKQSEAKALLPKYFSALDKAAKRGVIKGNNADRHKARAAARVASMEAAVPA
jgi:small subunit ribosomal protein S20